MVIIHIACIDTSLLGGVQVAVPQMVKAQSNYSSVGFINTHGDVIDGIQMLKYGKVFDLDNFPVPFNCPDVVIFHEVYRFEYIEIYKVLLKAKVPYIIIPHGCLSKQAQKRKFIKKLVGNVLFFNRFIKSACAVQYLSDNEALMSAFPQYPSFVSGNGITAPQTKKESFFENGVKFVYIGRLEIKTKGLDLLLKAVKLCEVPMRQVNSRLEIYGPDYDGAHTFLREMINSLGISDIVSVYAETVGKEKEKVLLSSDCFIQTSRTEGLPLGPLEALSYGLPCIVTTGVGLGELIETYGAGYRCATSAEGIADAIKRFVSDTEMIEVMSSAAVKLSEKKFNRDVIARKTVDKYSQTVEK